MFRKDCNYIVDSAIEHVLPDNAVKKALKGLNLPKKDGRLILVSIGKAAYRMAYSAVQEVGDSISEGIVITKYDHAQGAIDGIEIYEAGHPLPDNNTYKATRRALEITNNLRADDLVLFLVSGGGSALFESPSIAPDRLETITGDLLRSGADIREINCIRKRFSMVKGGRFAKHCLPASIYQIVLSDVIGDPLDVIASGPAYPDSSTSKEAYNIIEKYKIELTEEEHKLIGSDTVTSVDNVSTIVSGSVSELCKAAANAAQELGYKATILSDTMDTEASEAGRLLGHIALYSAKESSEKIAYIIGGETVVHVRGNGLGGRNQELALSAAKVIKGINNACVMSFGSDGTDGPTDAAGGYVDGNTVNNLMSKGIDVDIELTNNNAYYCLKSVDGLILTGPTGTNVNDVAVILVDSKH